MSVPDPLTDMDRSVAASLLASGGPLAEMDRIAMRDAYLTGWFHHETGELLEGFPIAAADIVLDAGCGDGIHARFCGQQGAEVYLADIDAGKVEAATRVVAGTGARAIHPLVTDCAPIPLPDASVTRVVALEVLEHVDDPRSFMGELVRVARPGARFLVSVPDPATENIQREIAPESYFRKPNHLRVFERGKLEELAVESGLVVERTVYFGFVWSVWFNMFWACGHGMTETWHPALAHWVRAWGALLDTPDGPRVKRALDQAMPKSQAIVARKPV